MALTITTLRNLVTRPGAKEAAYVWIRYPLRLDERCVLADDGELRPRVARKHRLTAHVPLADVLATVRRARTEKPDASAEDILSAVDWFYFLRGCQ